MKSEPISIKLHLERMSASFVQMVEEALSTEQIRAAVQKAVDRFDVEKEVERIVHMNLLERVHRTVMVAGTKVEMPIDYDRVADIVTICGVKYSGTLFRTFGSPVAVGKKFSVLKLENGVITLRMEE